MTPTNELRMAPMLTDAIAEAALRKRTLVRRRKNTLQKPAAETRI
jgi:hypothetical protein